MNDVHQRSELTSQTVTYYNAFIATKNHLRFTIGRRIACIRLVNV